MNANEIKKLSLSDRELRQIRECIATTIRSEALLQINPNDIKELRKLHDKIWRETLFVVPDTDFKSWNDLD